MYGVDGDMKTKYKVRSTLRWRAMQSTEGATSQRDSPKESPSCVVTATRVQCTRQQHAVPVTESWSFLTGALQPKAPKSLSHAQADEL